MPKSATTIVSTRPASFPITPKQNDVPPSLSDSDDIKNVDLTKIHNLSGPVAVEGAEPGDCLVVDILDGEYMIVY